MNAYDFDETIYDGESSLEFIFSYLKTDPKIITFLPTVIKIMYLYKKEKITFDDFTNKYAHTLKKYFAENDVDVSGLVTKFWDKHEKKIKPFYKDIQRDDDVIITASPEFMMREICNRIGVKHLLATDLDLKEGVVRKACFREGKIACFKEAFPEGEIDDFYTDSMNDQFLFPLAKRVFLVKGDKITQIK
ncbi:MAG: haloacid dehalogenase-like hydrolase [Faecalibacterium sp.]|nr:haloacid dehalogenase-like hydrolase [Ruminococcus sp.]MCM1391381.1 haloacid dehalogenase-like hydrolase [Ruminococcus sp.]MCM1484591.1 haloacid dehalogenase-like hydrolase [Faecalibacterium sp.]